jgi:putative aminopeptidase FrvX
LTRFMPRERERMEELMFAECKELLFALCHQPGTPGCEEEAMKAAASALDFCQELEVDPLCGVHGFLGNKGASRQIMLDAHIDQIGMVVTEIDEDGFLQGVNVGGIDRRTLPGSRVTVYGKEPRTGVVCMLPPHISGGEDKVAPVQEQAIDIGMCREEAVQVVSVGDRVILSNPVSSLLGNRVGGTALDDRAGCVCIIRAAQLLRGIPLKCGVHIVCSGKEEVGGQGAEIFARRICPTEAIVVDVSFARQDGLHRAGLGELSKGPMIGFSAVLNRRTSQKLIQVAEKNKIPYQLEAMGGRSGTNSDSIIATGAGVNCALLSVPQRNMHTSSEVCDLEDMENTAKLIAAYILETQERVSD